MANRFLFRQEALEAQRETLSGEVVVATPLSFSLLTALAVVIVLLAINFICWGEYTRKTHVKGYLAPSKGLIKVYPVQTGIIIEKHVVEGQQVERGQRLFVLSTESSSRETPAAQATAIARLQERRDSLSKELGQQRLVDRIQQRNLQTRRDAQQTELEQLNLEYETQLQRVTAAKDRVSRLQRLLKSRSVAALQVQEAQEAALNLQLQLQRIHRERTTLEREIDSLQLEQDAAALRAANQRSAIARDIKALEQQLTEYQARRTIVVTAPSAGQVSTILTAVGQTANPNTPLLSILPAGAQMQARLLIPSKAIGFIEPGQTVALRYEAFPHQRFGSYAGQTVRIAKTLLMPNEVQLPVALQEPVYLVDVKLAAQTVRAYSKTIPLQSGLLLDADISLDRRRLVEWLFDPLFSLKGRL